jgi:transposase
MVKPILSDELWAAIEPVLALHIPSPNGGHPRVSDRASLTGILFVLQTDIPGEYLPMMDVSSTLVPNAQPSEAMQPARRSFDHPTQTAQMFPALDAPPGDPWLDALGAQPLPTGNVVVALVGVKLGGALAWSPLQTSDGWQTLNEWAQQLGVMNWPPSA